MNLVREIGLATPSFYCPWHCSTHCIENCCMLLLLPPLLLFSDGSGTQNLVTDFGRPMEKWVSDCLRRRLFFIFFQTLKNHQICQKFAQKNEEKPSSTCLLNPFSGWFHVPENPISCTRKSGTCTVSVVHKSIEYVSFFKSKYWIHLIFQMGHCDAQTGFHAIWCG